MDKIPWFELSLELRLLAIEHTAEKRKAKKLEDRKRRQTLTKAPTRRRR